MEYCWSRKEILSMFQIIYPFLHKIFSWNTNCGNWYWWNSHNPSIIFWCWLYCGTNCCCPITTCKWGSCWNLNTLEGFSGIVTSIRQSGTSGGEVVQFSLDNPLENWVWDTSYVGPDAGSAVIGILQFHFTVVVLVLNGQFILLIEYLLR